MPATVNVMSQVMHSAVLGAPEPKVGDGVTICHWSDRSVGTITAVIAPDHITYTEDDTAADKSKGELQMGHQDWIHTPRPNGMIVHALRHRNGKWYIATVGKNGRYTVSVKSTPVAVGARNYYHDWSF
jgi:hypothetical protein